MRLGGVSAPDDVALAAGHFGRAFTATACGSPQVWSECLTALIRRSVVAWGRLEEFPDLRESVVQIELEQDSRTFLVAITTEPADEAGLPLEVQSRLAVHRATAWFNSHGDLWRTLAAAVSVVGMLVSAAAAIVENDVGLERFAQDLGADADALLSTG
jgi:hypothetical protein